jgi:hypothetical protein
VDRFVCVCVCVCLLGFLNANKMSSKSLPKKVTTASIDDLNYYNYNSTIVPFVVVVAFSNIPSFQLELDCLSAQNTHTSSQKTRQHLPSSCLMNMKYHSL